MNFDNLISSARISEPVGEASLVALDSIKDRASDTRELNESHVGDLAESIGAIGLIEPLVTDKNHVLLAGGHRKAAIAKLQESDPDKFAQHFPDALVPVHILDFSAADEPDRALAIELAENEKRRDYTPSEVKALADRLKSKGYTFSKGKPPKGKSAGLPVLSTIIGKSRRTVQRYLEAGSAVNVTNGAFTPDLYLDRAIANIQKWEKETGNNASKLIRSIEKKKGN